MAYKLCQYVRPQCDELIIAEDTKCFYKELYDISDIYLSHWNWGDMKNTRTAAPLFTGDYLVTIQSDVEIHSGNIRDLCVPGKLVSPQDSIYGYYHGALDAFFVIPRSVFEERGYLMYHHGNYFADNKDIFEWSDKVQITHHQGGTSMHPKRLQQEQRERSSNPELFKESLPR